MTIFGPLQKIPFEVCPRTPFFTTHYARALSRSFPLLAVPLAPSWPPLRARHKTYGFYRTGWPSPLQNPSKMLTFALGLPGGFCRKEHCGSHLRPILGRLGHILLASWGISRASSALLRGASASLPSSASLAHRYFLRSYLSSPCFLCVQLHGARSAFR